MEILADFDRELAIGRSSKSLISNNTISKINTTTKLNEKFNLIQESTTNTKRKKKKKQREMSASINKLLKLKGPETETPRMLLLLNCLLLATAGLLVIDRLPAAEAWNLFDGPQLSFQNSQSIDGKPTDLLGSSHSEADARGLPSDTVKPSPLGKILEVAADHALNSSNSTSVSSSFSPAPSSDHPSRAIGMQLLKPRKASSQDSSSRQQVAAVEQQIINQHSRLHLSGGSHQRLLPVKHRDQKVVDSMLNPASVTSDIRDSPLASLFGGFKSSAITSRSSIVKAISDNKLARTALSTVSKTLGGNKYVAGAAAASALAALGLTVSKFLSPYFLAGGGGYSKLGDPMLPAGSFLSPSFTTPTFDRNYVLLNPSSDALMASGSSLHSPAMATRAQSASASQNYPYEFEPTSGSYDLSGSNVGNGNMALPQTFFSSSPSASAPSDSVYLTYSPRPSQPQTFASAPSSYPATSGEPTNKQQLDATSGHYTSFYAQDGGGSSGMSHYDAPSGKYLLTTNSQMSQSAGSSDPRFSSSSSPSSQISFPGPQSSSDSNQDSGDGSQFYNYNSNNQYSDSLMPAASIDSPSFSKPAESQILNARRAGAVTLKMDDATRTRLYQHLLKQRQLTRISTAPVGQSGGASGQMRTERSNQIAGVFVPISSGTPSAEVYSSSSSSLQPSKSGRFKEPNSSSDGRFSALYIDQGGLRAPFDNGRQHQQQVATSSSSPGYLAARPSAERQQSLQSEAKTQSGSNPWKSLSAHQDAKPSSWQSMAANKQQIDESNLQQPQNSQPQQTSDYDQQASNSAPRSQVASPTATAAYGQEEQVSVSHRVSRTLNQSSVKVSRPPMATHLTDYSVGGGSLVGSINLVAGQQRQQPQQGASLATSAADSSKKSEQKSVQQQQEVLTNHRDIGSTGTSGGDDSKTNLIQLNSDNSDEDNKNNVIKLIDASTNDGSGAKLAAASDPGQYDAGLVIMSAPNRATDNKRSNTGEQDATASTGASESNHSHHYHNNGDHNSSNNQQQQWTATATGKSQVSGDFPEMGTLTRSFSDFTAGD